MSTHTTTATPSPTVRRLVLLVLAATILLTGIGLGASPASADPPLKPRSIQARGYDDFVKVYWSPPVEVIGFDEPDGYQVERTAPNVPTKTWARADTAPLIDSTGVLNLIYSYRVRAHSDEGWGPWSDISKASRNVSFDELDPFSTTAVFVNRVHQDFLGRPATNGEKSQYSQLIDGKVLTPAAFVNQVYAKSDRTARHQVIRLYQAYFGRNADSAGLDFWVDQIENHGKSINTVSNSFAGSNEFKVTYGNLTNAQFVNLVYQNVLDRNPSPTDANYWKGQLDSKAIGRGRMMTLFSESGEYKALSRGLVLAADVYDTITGLESKGSELDHWSSHIQGGGNPGDYALLVYQYAY